MNELKTNSEVIVSSSQVNPKYLQHNRHPPLPYGTKVKTVDAPKSSDIETPLLKCPNSIIKDYSATVETILSEIRLKCVVPKHLLEKDKFYLYRISMRTQRDINDNLIKPLLIKLYDNSIM